MDARCRERYSFFRLLGLALRQVGVGATGLWVANGLMSIAHGLSWGVGVWAAQVFFDAVAGAVGGSTPASAAYGGLALLGGVTIAQQVLNGVQNFMADCYFQKVQGFLVRKLARKAAFIDPVCYESPSFLNDVDKAAEGAHHIMELLYYVTGIGFYFLPYFLFMAVYLHEQKPELVWAILIAFTPVALTQWIRATAFEKLEDEAAPLRRKRDYYQKCLTDREFCKETRLLGANLYFINLLRSSLCLLSKIAWGTSKRSVRWELSMKAITLVGYFGILYMLVDALLKAEISVGAFAAVFASLGELFGMMEGLLCYWIGDMTRNLGTVRNFARFMDAPERGGEDGAVNAGRGVELQGVSFRYPGAERDAILNVSLSIASGETLAVVGENGAGKTTLIRLLVGLYLPTQGEVAIGGMSTRGLSMRSVYEGISAVFQKYQRYRLTLSENVRVSDMDDVGVADASRVEADREAEAIGKADLDMAAFPDGGSTMLSREFDGIDLSGGQWQRVAIARGLYRAHELIVLDEPTAAIDPLEETRVYRQFAEMSKGRTSVIVTHRMGSARIADRIAVMADGKIADIGTHDELMARGGHYADMVNAQAGWYK